MFGITLTIALVFLAGFIVGSLFPQPEFIRETWAKVTDYFNSL